MSMEQDEVLASQDNEIVPIHNIDDFEHVRGRVFYKQVQHMTDSTKNHNWLPVWTMASQEEARRLLIN